MSQSTEYRRWWRAEANPNSKQNGQVDGSVINQNENYEREGIWFSSMGGRGMWTGLLGDAGCAFDVVHYKHQQNTAEQNASRLSMWT